jgi:ribosomal protein L7/L12
VILVSAGPRPDKVITTLRLVARLDRASARDIVTAAPTLLVEHLHLSSAELVVESLEAAGAEARLEHEETWVKEPPPA